MKISTYNSMNIILEDLVKSNWLYKNQYKDYKFSIDKNLKKEVENMKEYTIQELINFKGEDFIRFRKIK